MNYNQAKQTVQNENYLNAADKSIIRKKREAFLETFDSRNSGYSRFPYGADIAYEAMGLFSEEIVGRYCITTSSNSRQAAKEQIHQDTENICELYQLRIFIQFYNEATYTNGDNIIEEPINDS